MTWFVNLRKRYKIMRERPQFWHFPELGVGYIQIPKVATRSIRAGLMRGQGVASGHTDFTAFEETFSRHISQTDIRKVAATTHIFAFVRHPLARLYSAYTDKILNARGEGRRNIFACHDLRFGMAFDEFVERVCDIDDRHIDRHLRSQSWFLTDDEGLIPDFIGHLESFNADWDRLRVDFPEFGAMPHLNVAAGDTDFLAKYSSHTLELAAKRFASDLELFNYSSKAIRARDTSQLQR